MFLLFEPVRQGIRYAAFTPELEMIYDGFCPVEAWNQRTVSSNFQSHILAKLRGHGRVFSRIGVILPFAETEHNKPKLADPAFIKRMAKTSLREKILMPSLLVLQASKQAWPHLPHYFLFDTHLSGSLSRDIVLAPFDYDTNKQLAIQPYLLHSYGHCANLLKVKDKKPVISLYIGDQASAALFEDHELKDAIVSYSPLSSIMGFNGLGSADYGFFLDLGEKKRHKDLLHLLSERTGLHPMTETTFDLDTLLQIAGLIPRNSVNTDDYPIESIEWIELSLRSFIRSLRHAVGGLAAHDHDVKTLVVNTSLIPESSGFWPLLVQGGLKHMQIIPSSYSLLQAASTDLVTANEKGS